MRVDETSFPSESLLFSNKDTFDYYDTFEGAIVGDTSGITKKDLIRAFFESAPDWVAKLMRLRNAIVGRLGLKTDGPSVQDLKSMIQSFEGKKGEAIGLFRVQESNENEIIFGENDKHLDFRVSLLMRDQNRIAITTVVIFNNVFGRIYFLPVKPFHKVIVKAMLKGVIRQLSK